MWRGKRVAVIFPTYNEKDSIRASIREYLDTGLVDDLIVVNNNAAPGTS
jgi:glycosyltransferase involved in cell wall biosynthesis